MGFKDSTKLAFARGKKRFSFQMWDLKKPSIASNLIGDICFSFQMWDLKNFLETYL